MTSSSIMDDILKELKRAKKKHAWPDHVVAQAAIVCEESGELIRAAINLKYERKKGAEEKSQKEELRREAIQTAAMAIRFIENLK